MAEYMGEPSRAQPGRFIFRTWMDDGVMFDVRAKRGDDMPADMFDALKLGDVVTVNGRDGFAVGINSGIGVALVSHEMHERQRFLREYGRRQ